MGGGSTLFMVLRKKDDGDVEARKSRVSKRQASTSSSLVLSLIHLLPALLQLNAK